MREQAIKEAERIFDQHYTILYESKEFGDFILALHYTAKRCALADIQNSIDAIDQAGTDAERNFVDDTYRFYEMVKEEIENL